MSARGKQRAGKDRKSVWKAHTGPGGRGEVQKVEGRRGEV